MDSEYHSRGEVSDLASLAKLDENILLEEIKERYRQDKIYTNVGDILLSVNPFKDLGIYGTEVSNKYKGIKRSVQPPHIFAVADAAYQALLGNAGREPANQCVLISGESGAGKTESTKLIIKQLIELCKGNTQLEQQILQVNPLLEAFGNAQTNLNDNSSRFGKYIQLKFDTASGQVVGAKISEYLLEKSRVVRQNIGEENFHIFYYLFASDKDGKFGLGSPSSYRYLTNKAENFNRKLDSLHESYEDLVNAMDLVGFTDEEQLDLFAIITGILLLGNVCFKANEDDSVGVTDSNGPVKEASKYLGIPSSEVEACLTCMVTVTKGEYLKRNYSLQQAEDARDAMSKALYGRLFGWIVNKINTLLAPEIVYEQKALSEIGILDIFGFEDFTKSGGKNSFEQACINLANEQLQFFFNQHIFKMEQEEYQREGIDWKEINFVDNKPLLDMFLGKPIGILSLLDEESLFPKGTDQSYVEKLVKAMGANENFVKSPQTNQAVFTINHYAGKVTYDVNNWLEKNRDTLPPGLTENLQSSDNCLCKTIFRGQITRTGSLALQGRKTASRKSRMIKQRSPAAQLGDAAKRKMTVGGQFKNSLNILMERMTSSTPLFVRCLKPNHEKKPGLFDGKYVLAQLLYTGMLETVEIRRKGFAVRPNFAEFVEKYSILVDLKMEHSKQSCIRILECTKLKGWYTGKSKVFLKYTHIELLTDILIQMGKSAVHLQRVARGFMARREFKRRLAKAEEEKRKVAEMMEAARLLNLQTVENLRKLKEQNEKNAAENANQHNLKPEVPYFPSDGISMRSGRSYLDPVTPTKTTASTGTQMEETSDSDSDVLEDDFKPVNSNLAKFGRAGTKKAAVSWFKETQTLNVIDQNENKFAEWFHGIISRRESEKLLQDKIVGCFLIRVSESRFGYTLSFRAETRCRHYMIDQLKNGKFIVVGEPKVHRSLQNLVNYHKKTKLSNWDHSLSVPCGQMHGECDYMDLVPENFYVMLEDDANKPPIPERNYSIQRSLQPRRRTPSAPSDTITSATQPPGNVREGRPLPKLPEEAYTQLMKDADDGHSYKSLEAHGKLKGKSGK